MPGTECLSAKCVSQHNKHWLIHAHHRSAHTTHQEALKAVKLWIHVLARVTSTDSYTHTHTHTHTVVVPFHFHLIKHLSSHNKQVAAIGPREASIISQTQTQTYSPDLQLTAALSWPQASKDSSCTTSCSCKASSKNSSP